MKTVLVAAALVSVMLGGLACLSDFPAGYADNGVYADLSSPVGALASYIAAVYAVNERMEIGTASRALRYQCNRYRGWDVEFRTHGLAEKMRSYSQTTFRIRTVKVWGQSAVITVDQVLSVGRCVPYTFTFEMEDGIWRISGMSTDVGVKF